MENNMLTLFEKAPYKVIMGKDYTNGIIVQIVKAEEVRVRDRSGSVSTTSKETVVEQRIIFFDDDSDKVKDYDTLDKELDKTVAFFINKTKRLDTKEALGNNLMNKIKNKYVK